MNFYMVSSCLGSFMPITDMKYALAEIKFHFDSKISPAFDIGKITNSKKGSKTK